MRLAMIRPAVLPGIIPRHRDSQASGAGKSLPETFADQFRVWQSALMNPARPFSGTIIRVPLQKDRAASSICQHTLSVEDAAASVQSWAQKAGKSLLFLKHVMRLGLSIWRPNAITLTNLMEVRCRYWSSRAHPLLFWKELYEGHSGILPRKFLQISRGFPWGFQQNSSDASF